MANELEMRTKAREGFLMMVKSAASEYAAAQPISVPAAEQARAMDRVIAAFRAAAAKDAKFYSATPESLARALALCALTGLLPGGPMPEVDLIPRTKRVKLPNGQWGDGPAEIHWQIGWRGYVALAARAGRRISAVAVYRGEGFEWQEGVHRELIHLPNLDVPGYGTWDALRCVYVIARPSDRNEDPDWRVLDRAGIEARRARSEAWRAYEELTAADRDGRLAESDRWKLRNAAETPWVLWPVEMALKTAIRYAASRGLFAMDERAAFAFERDGEDDGRVVLAEEPAAPARPAAPLRGPAAVRGALGLVEESTVGDGGDRDPASWIPDPPPPLDPPDPGTPRSGDTRSSGGGSGTTEEKRSARPRNDVVDAESARDHVTRKFGVAAVIPPELFRQEVAASLGLARMSQDRFDGLFLRGASEGYWRRTDAGTIRLGGEVERQPSDETPEPAKPMSRDELLASVVDAEQMAREAGVDLAPLRDACRVRDETGALRVDDEGALRGYLALLLQRLAVQP